LLRLTSQKGRRGAEVALRDGAGAGSPGFTPDPDARQGPGAVGQEGNFESGGDEAVEQSIWRGDSSANNFRFMDDLEPVAPMDKVGGKVVGSATGGFRDALYIPPYLYPDAFPTVEGPTCTCREPKEVPPTEAQEELSENVAKSLGVDVSELPQPIYARGGNKCKCDGGGEGTFHWVKLEAAGGRNYTLTPADTTYNAGNYWEPKVRGGLVAPEDRMTAKDYPLQAKGDRVMPLPAMAKEDRIKVKFAKYIDQLEARSRECDTVSKACTTPCRPGDNVTLVLGNTELGAEVISTHVGNALRVEFIPTAARDAAKTVPCPVTAGCSAFRICHRPGTYDCVEQKDKKTHDYQGLLKTRHVCPRRFSLCSYVQEIVTATYAKKDGKACVSAAEDEE
jgi:hypothetical protein